MFLLIIFSILLLSQKICFEIAFISVELVVEINRASCGKLPLRLKESHNFVKGSCCSFAGRTLLSLYGRIRSQFIFWALNPIPWGTTLSVDSNATVMIQVPSTPVVKTYNNNMGGVDFNDQMQWWHCLLQL